MARPGQNALRKRKLAEAAQAAQEVNTSDPQAAPEDAEDADSSGGEQPTTYAQVLPVAVLGDDWDGQVLDGATYLGLASRENAKLPSFKRVANPYQTFEDQDLTMNRAGSSRQSFDVSNGESGPSTPRHPALPKDSWEMLFPIHFVNYKKRILANWPPSPLPPYPSDYPRIPNVHDRLDLMYFINGYPRARVRLEEKSEEEMMNLRPRANGATGGVPGASGTGDRSAYGQEPEGPRHRRRDPTVDILGRLSTSEVLKALSRISKVLSYSLDHVASSLQLPTLPEQYATLLPTQPQSPDSSASSLASPPASRQRLVPDPQATTPAGTVIPHPTTPNPLSSHVARWIFALLLIVDEYLPGDDLSTLRELARVVMRIAAWRWIEGVHTGEVAEGHALGQKRKEQWDRHAQTASSSKQGLFDGEDTRDGVYESQEDEDETSVDAVLSRCWLIVHAVARGWAQKDLLDDLRGMFT